MGLLSDDATISNSGTQNMLNQANQSATKQKGLVDTNFDKLQGLNAPYQAGVHQQGLDYQNESRAAGDKFLNDIGSSSDKLGENLSDALTRHAFANQPALSNQLREQLAGSGGLSRGAYDQGAMQQQQQLAGSLYDGQQGIVNEQLQARQNAMGQVYGNDNALIDSRYGNDVGATNSVYGNSRSDLNSQNADNLGIEQNLNNQTLSTLLNQTNNGIASNAASNQGNSALLGSLLAAGGTAAGAYFGGPVGAAAGNAAGRGIAGQLNNTRGTVQSA